MDLVKRIGLNLFFITLIGGPSLWAQKTWEERIEEKTDSNWFWDWLFGSPEEHTWHQAEPVVDIYAGLNLKTSFTRRWKFSIGDNEKWADLLYDDQYWETIKVPSDWENQGFHGYDGFAWYRIHFNGADLDENQTHFLVLGQIDDADEAYFNGNLIGKSGRFPPPFRTAYNHQRKYTIPNEIINFEGENVVAIRVYDQRLNGGIVHGQPGIYAAKGSDILLQDLAGSWKFTKNNNPLHSNYNFDDSYWENMSVPAFWGNQGYRSLDGIAWYRKHFDLCFDFDATKNYYLVLGHIDDFDITFLNGREIGRTDDELTYGKSKSYLKIRVYKIPRGWLKPLQENTIAVKVYDIGKEGGIYKGPVGIVDEDSVTRLLRSSY